MGVLTEFIVADVAEAARVSDQRDDLTCIAAKGIDQVRMGTLYAILTGTNHDLVTEESFVHKASDDGPWVQLVPVEMVRRLAAMSDQELPGIADAWSATEEFRSKYSRWAREDIDGLLRQLRSASAEAVEHDKALLMCTSL